MLYRVLMWLRFMATGAVFVLTCTYSAALCPSPSPRPCYLFHRSTVTFIGTVIQEVEAAGDSDHDAGIVYTLRVVSQFRGAPASTIDVFTEGNSGGEYLGMDKTYIVFAMQGDRTHPLLVACSLTREITDVESAARMLEGVRQQKGDVDLRGTVKDRSRRVAGATCSYAVLVAP